MASRKSARQPQSFLRDDSNSDTEEDDVEMQTQPRRGRARSDTRSFSSTEALPTNDDDPTLILQPTRRGRGPAKSHVGNRNAIMARENRERKKRYIEAIENRNKFLEQENKGLRKQIREHEESLRQLNTEVAYMKNVLQNNTMVTWLLKSINETLSKASDKNYKMPSNTESPDKSADVENWVASGQNNQSNSAVSSMSPHFSESSEVLKGEKRPFACGSSAIPQKIARKSMPLICNLKSENPSSVESSLLEEDDKMSLQQKSSSESVSYCEYNREQSSSRFDSQQPTTPMSQNISEPLDKYEASLSDVECDELSSSFMLKFDDYVFPVDQDSQQMFNHDTFFELDNELQKENILSKETIDPLEMSKIPNALMEKTLFNCPDNTGVCLHINSTRVSLEYCSICHSNSLKAQVV